MEARGREIEGEMRKRARERGIRAGERENGGEKRKRETSPKKKTIMIQKKKIGEDFGPLILIQWLIPFCPSLSLIFCPSGERDWYKGIPTGFAPLKTNLRSPVKYQTILIPRKYPSSYTF